jgi:hypothetical protein
MNIQKWFNNLGIEPIQDRIDNKDYWNTRNIYSEDDLIECLNKLKEDLKK